MYVCSHIAHDQIMYVSLYYILHSPFLSILWEVIGSFIRDKKVHLLLCFMLYECNDVCDVHIIHVLRVRVHIILFYKIEIHNMNRKLAWHVCSDQSECNDVCDVRIINVLSVRVHIQSPPFLWFSGKAQDILLS